jgi:acetyl-CoA acetyltransferase family protein
MGETAELLASMYRISRDQQDEYAFESHRRAPDAIQLGRFKEEITTISTEAGGCFNIDEHVRADVSMEEIRKLPPVFSKAGTVTTANSSGITDGAAAALLVSEDEVKRQNLAPLARVVDYAVAGVDPKIMGIGPVPAVKKLLKKTGLSLADFGLMELNEAFAAQVLACLAELPVDRNPLNVNGGAIALGHPIGCTGVRIVTTLIYEMRKRGVRYVLLRFV